MYNNQLNFTDDFVLTAISLHVSHVVKNSKGVRHQNSTCPMSEKHTYHSITALLSSSSAPPATIKYAIEDGRSILDNNSNNNDKDRILQSHVNHNNNNNSNVILHNNIRDDSSITSCINARLKSSMGNSSNNNGRNNDNISSFHINYSNGNQYNNNDIVNKYSRQCHHVNNVNRALIHSSNNFFSHNSNTTTTTNSSSNGNTGKYDMHNINRHHTVYSEKLHSSNSVFIHDNSTSMNNQLLSKNTPQAIASSSSSSSSSKALSHSSYTNYSNNVTNFTKNLFINDVNNPIQSRGASASGIAVTAISLPVTSSILPPTNSSTNLSRVNHSLGQNYLNYFRHHSTRASPITVQWLLENYESADGVSLSRSALYSHYLTHCLENWLEPMNPASFGKLIRSIFVGLRTRRLGTRGNSKYHYYGIRIKATSLLDQTTEVKPVNISNKRDQFSYTNRTTLNSTSSSNNNGNNTILSRNENYRTINHQQSHRLQHQSHPLLSCPLQSQSHQHYPPNHHQHHHPHHHQQQPQQQQNQTNHQMNSLGIESNSYRYSIKSEKCCFKSSLSALMTTNNHHSQGMINSLSNNNNNNNNTYYNDNYKIMNELHTGITCNMSLISTKEYNKNNYDNSLLNLWRTNSMNSIRCKQNFIIPSNTTNNNESNSSSTDYNKNKLISYECMQPVIMKNLLNSNIQADFDVDLNLGLKWDFLVNINNNNNSNNKVVWHEKMNQNESENTTKLHFGDDPNHKFTFSNLMELCALSGLQINENDIFGCIIKPEFNERYQENSPQKLNSQQIAYFVKLYETHCEQVCAAFIHIQIENLRTIWHQFWCSSESTICASECCLPKSYLIDLCEDSHICQFIELADRTLYQLLLDIIIRDSLKALSNELIQGLQTMIKLMEPYLQSAIRYFNPHLINRKLSAVNCLTKGLHRALGINCFSQTIENVINDTQKCAQILNDINKLDLKSIEAQGSWASDCSLYGLLQNSLDLYSNDFNPSKCSLHKGIKQEPTDQCIPQIPYKLLDSNINTKHVFSDIYNFDENFINTTETTATTTTTDNGVNINVLHSEMCNLLMNKSTLTTWTKWLDKIVTRSLVNSQSGPKRANTARQLMLVWTYYSSLLMRELTLRSAISFGNCHLLRMFCDEYLSYRLEQVASSPLTTLPKSINESLPIISYTHKNHNNNNDITHIANISATNMQGINNQSNKTGNMPENTFNPTILPDPFESTCNEDENKGDSQCHTTIVSTTSNEVSSEDCNINDDDILMENSNTTLLLSSVNNNSNNNSSNYFEYMDAQILSNHDNVIVDDDVDVDDGGDHDDDGLCSNLSPHTLLQENVTNSDNLLFCNMHENETDDITIVDDTSGSNILDVSDNNSNSKCIKTKQDASVLDTSNSCFSFGLCNDPVLTETTGLNSNNNDNNNHGSSDHNLYGKKMLANNAFLDDDDDAVKNNWSCLRQDESVDQYSDKISPNYDKMMFTSSSSSSSLTKINLNTENNRTPFSDITNYLLYDSRTRTDTTTNNNSNVLTTTSSCGSSSIVSTQSSCSPSFSSNRSHRKLSKPN
uniref:RFX-type winged-helix domain-containing protein n=1 Tax=Trichobilharzia regenti TaxID=157069 RepID=A0AA85IWM7_TRIRE